MPKYSKAQLLTLRSNIDQYLKKEEETENVTYRKLSQSFSSSKATLDQILNRIENGVGYEKFATALKALKNDMGQAINATRPDMSGIASALKEFQTSVNIVLSEQKKTDQTILSYLTPLSKALAEKPKEKQVKDRTDEIITALKKIKVEIPELEFPKSISVDNFPPQRVAVPQNNVWINPLQGYIETTSVTVGTTITQLPDYGQLFNRRAVMVYNNSANTIFVGGSEVTTSNGLPVPASSYSPIFDAGYNCVVYGVASQAGNNARVLEISKDKSEVVQQ